MKRLNLLLVLLLIGCGPSSGREIASTELGAAWPFTVERGVVDCDAQGRLIFKTRAPDTTGVWALTGEARAGGYPAVDRFWRDNPTIPGTKVPLTEVIALAQDECR